MGIKEFDIFVIGTGTAGKMVATACVKAGKSVAIADNREYGGTCANRGCDPKKVIVGLTEIMERSQNMLGHGITKLPEFSWEDLQKFKKTFTDAVPFVTEKDFKNIGVELYHQSPKFIDENTLSVEGKTVKAKNIVIACGNKPLELKIPGIEHALVSDDFLELEELPKSMLFIGAGFIGMEFAHVAARMGVDVTVIDFSSRPLSNFDEDMVKYLTKVSQEIGIKFIFNAKVNGIEKLQKYYRVSADQEGKEISVKAELVINAAGRVPSIDELELENGKVTFTKRGITVNKKLQNSSNKSVYACGDVSDSEGLPLTPLSSLEARVVVSQLLDKTKKEEAHFPPQPSVVFTLPNVASVGLSEEEAKSKGYEVIVEKKNGSKWYNAKRTNNKVYACKIIEEKETGKILGAHLVGPEAGEVINLFAMAIYCKLNRSDLKQMIFGYPTWGNDIKGMV